MSLPKKSKVEDNNYAVSYRKTRARQHRKFLYNVVLPHLETMPTAEEALEDTRRTNPDLASATYTSSRVCAIPGKAILNLNQYVRVADHNVPVNRSNKYNCGRTGCFAGWYVMISDNYNRLSEYERSDIEDYNTGDLAEHFGISHKEAGWLFGALGQGIEKFHEPSREALKKRAEKLKSIMTRKGDFK